LKRVKRPDRVGVNDDAEYAEKEKSKNREKQQISEVFLKQTRGG
jgi:hypothetical protein